MGNDGNILKPSFVSRYYSGIIVGLVLINTALIMFLIVYIWALAPSQTEIANGASIAQGVVRADRLIMWSEPGGLEHGAESRGVLEKGGTVEVLRGQRFESELWLEVRMTERQGWIPERDIEYLPRNEP